MEDPRGINDLRELPTRAIIFAHGAEPKEQVQGARV